MDYKPFIVLTAGLAAVIAWAQASRSPDEIMRDEKPACDSFITVTTKEDVISLARSKASQLGFKIHQMNNNGIVLTNNAGFFSYGYVLKIEVEESNEWSNKVYLSLFSKAETGYGNRVVRKGRLGKLMKELREELVMHQR